MSTKTKALEMREAEDQIEIDLVELFYYYLSKIWFIIIAFLIGAVAAGMITHFMITPKYTATSKVYMVSTTTGSALDLSDLNLGTSLSADYVELLKIRPIYEDAIEELKLDYSYRQLQKMVTISSVSGTRIITISAQSTDPEEARDIANVLADKAVTYIPELMETPAPHIAEHALLPTVPSSPSLTKNTVLGALLMTILCLGILTVLFLMDDTLKSEGDVEKLFGVMPLTVIPEGDFNKSGIHIRRRFNNIRRKKKK
ncbi:MAG: Wzz/FepE/Etk N-terminal domain-containing protein [Eubacteriales bacterium]|nr:Wzz/FepE/Etk N-terminal domain-containing protein [Eubacteriales bacterium]